MAVPHINAGKRTANIKGTLVFGACRPGLDAFTVKILISLVTLYYVSSKKATFSNCEALPYFYIFLTLVGVRILSTLAATATK